MSADKKDWSVKGTRVKHLLLTIQIHMFLMILRVVVSRHSRLYSLMNSKYHFVSPLWWTEMIRARIDIEVLSITQGFINLGVALIQICPVLCEADL
jgi:hypothetical protein